MTPRVVYVLYFTGGCRYANTVIKFIKEHIRSHLVLLVDANNIWNMPYTNLPVLVQSGTNITFRSVKLLEFLYFLSNSANNRIAFCK